MTTSVFYWLTAVEIIIFIIAHSILNIFIPNKAELIFLTSLIVISVEILSIVYIIKERRKSNDNIT